VIAVELTNKHQVKRVYIKSIDDYSSKSLITIFEEHVSISVKVFTDKWRGYESLKATYDITQIKRDNGNNFKKLHIMIHLVKSWLRTVPTHLSKQHIQKYFDEFTYRINRLQSKNTIWYNSIMRMIQNRPFTWRQIK
jgi:transposase-like protein